MSDSEVRTVIDGAEVVDLAVPAAAPSDGPENRADSLPPSSGGGGRRRRGQDDEELAAAVAEVNQGHAMVMVGDKVLVLRETRANGRVVDTDFMSVQALGNWLENKRVWTGARTGDGTVSYADIWRRSPERRQYVGVEFDPDRPSGGANGQIYNMWMGWAVEPAPAYADWREHERHFPTLIDHVRVNICREDPELNQWVWGWFAHMLQKPTERIGTALVLRGRQGTGKTTLGDVVGRLLGKHYSLVDDAKRITGQFNVHMKSCLLMQADEGFWAGDKVAEGKLKSLITSSSHLIEPKGVDPIRVNNFVHLLVTSNNSWVVPAGPEERRFAVLDIGENSMQNGEYFGTLYRELENGGYQHLLAWLLAMPLDGIPLRQIPKTAALMDQKIASLSPVQAWWYERLRAGDLGWQRDDEGELIRGGWPIWIPTDVLYSDYSAWMDRLGRGAKRTQEQTIRELLGMFGTADRQIYRSRRQEGGKKRWGYVLPSLDYCRARFDDLGLGGDWDDPSERSGDGAS